MNCGDQMSDKTESIEDLNAALDAVLQHIARYRLTVFHAVSKLPELQGLGPRFVRHVLASGVDRKLLMTAQLHSSARYWALSADGAKHCGLPTDRSGALSQPARLRAFSILSYCRLSGRRVQRLQSEEIESRFPPLRQKGMPGTYYLNNDGKGCLGLFRVDGAGQGRWDRIVTSIREDVDRHHRLAPLQPFIRSGRFEITLLTILPSKAQRLMEALEQYPDTRRIPVHVVAQPRVLPLITESHRKEKRRRHPRHGFHRSPAQEHGKTTSQ